MVDLETAEGLEYTPKNMECSSGYPMLPLGNERNQRYKMYAFFKKIRATESKDFSIDFNTIKQAL